jgi:hypothetical protein
MIVAMSHHCLVVRLLHILKTFFLYSLATTHPLPGHKSNPATKCFRRLQIAVRWCNLRTCICIGLRHSPKPTAQTIEIFNAAGTAIPTRIEAEIDPVHAMLSCQDHKINERVKLIPRD